MLNRITHGVLWLIALQFNLRPTLKAYMKGRDGYIDVAVAI